MESMTKHMQIKGDRYFQSHRSFNLFISDIQVLKPSSKEKGQTWIRIHLSQVAMKYVGAKLEYLLSTNLMRPPRDTICYAIFSKSYKTKAPMACSLRIL